MSRTRLDGRPSLPNGVDFLTKFWYNVPERGDGCWEWTGNRNDLGYGVFPLSRADGTFSSVPASRLAWMLTFADDLAYYDLVCHHCDNPPCVKPAHLFLGTHLDNLKDAQAKGRIPTRQWKPRGVRVPRTGDWAWAARFTSAMIREMHRRWVPGVYGIARVARDFECDTSTVSRIVNGHRWPEVAAEFGRGPLAKEAA